MYAAHWPDAALFCMQGRLHGYEGYAPDEVAYPVYVLKELGVKALCRDECLRRH